jgi:hypothetical protein
MGGGGEKGEERKKETERKRGREKKERRKKNREKIIHFLEIMIHNFIDYIIIIIK